MGFGAFLMKRCVDLRRGRWIVYEALRNGEYYPWDYQPLKKASERFMRNHMDLNVLEESQRFPRGGVNLISAISL